MAPINFENNMKDKLDRRVLKPSVDAWDKLSERLENQDEKSNKKTYWWLGLAASVVGVLLIVSQFLNHEININNAPKIVDTQETIQQNEVNTMVVNNAVLQNTKQTNVKIEIGTIEKIKIQKLVDKRKGKALVASANVYETVFEEKVNALAALELQKKSLTIEERKIQDVVAHVQNMKAKNIDVTDADIDVLLKEAQKEIIRNRIYNKTTSVVDANALFQDVEAELNQSSFRNKVFEALKSSYNSVKTAVAHRND